MEDEQLTQFILALVKIALMVFTLIHAMLIVFVMRQIAIMHKLLSKFRQWSLELVGAGILISLLGLLIYIILLP